MVIVLAHIRPGAADKLNDALEAQPMASYLLVHVPLSTLLLVSLVEWTRREKFEAIKKSLVNSLMEGEPRLR